MQYCEFDNLELAIGEIQKALGSGSSHPEILRAMERVRPKALKLISPRSIYTILPVTISGSKQVLLDGRFPLTCNSRFFRGASHAALAICTVGGVLEHESSRLFTQKSYAEGFILDACGSAALDEVVGQTRQKIAEEAKGFSLGYTLSPGCNMIPLEDQVIVFSLLDMEQVGVGITDAYMMQPAKSISLIIPLGAELVMQSKVNYACEICALQKSCSYSQLNRNS